MSSLFKLEISQAVDFDDSLVMVLALEALQSSFQEFTLHSCFTHKIFPCLKFVFLDYSFYVPF